MTIKISFSYKIIINLVLIFLLGISCQRGKDIVSEDAYIEILTDIHIYDAVLVKENMLDRNITNGDSVSFYNQLYAKHKISNGDLKLNIEYYSKDLDNLVKIYAKVNNRLQERLASLDSMGDDSFNKDSLNLWNQKKVWHLPEDGENHTIDFSVTTNKAGKYELNADILVYEDDKSVNPRMRLNANYKDGSFASNEIIINKQTTDYKNYKVHIITDINKELEYLSGWILYHDKVKGAKHIRVKNIHLKIVN